MKVSVKSIVPVLIIIACALSLYFCRSVPVSRIWKNYQVLYVDAAVPQKAVSDALVEEGCRDVICLAEQRTPLFSPFTPVEPNVDATNYLSRRLGYFTDESQKYALYYIPENFEKQTSQALARIIKDTGKTAGLDGKSSFPWLVPLVCLVLYLLFGCYAKNRMVYFASGIFPLLFSLSKPFYPDAAAVSLILLGLFIAERFWKRAGAPKRLATNVYTMLLLVTATAVVCTYSWQGGLLLLLVYLATLANLSLVSQIENAADKRKSFTYSFIIPAKLMPVMSQKTTVSLVISGGAVLMLLVIYFSSARLVPSVSVQGLSLPAPEAGKNLEDDSDMVELPTIDDYYVWSWNTVTYPYRNLNDKSGGAVTQVKKGDVVTIPEYKKTDKGIQIQDTVMYEFNNEFMNNAERSIDALDYPAVEKLMKKQGSGIVVTYSQKSRGETGRDAASLVLLLICLGIPLLLYLYYSVVGRKKYENSN